ncbi:hypothetical protein [Treponema denticola]|uniref:hypothetical protein n=1 Tax=Treponema denticola TaxID=158 RepID=UPI0020A3AFA8|nr:hypothetical protein [Treponema denticola]UTC82787.1 hypothetical protein HGJ18_06040 [Treponema denticola]
MKKLLFFIALIIIAVIVSIMITYLFKITANKKKRPLIYYWLKKIVFLLLIIDSSIVFILIHLKTNGLWKNYKEFINPIADSILLGLILNFINIIFKNISSLNQFRIAKENIENVLKPSILRLIFGKEEIPDIAFVKLEEICDKAIKNIEKLPDENFEGFYHTIRMERNSILFNQSEAAKIDRTHVFIYNGITSNLSEFLLRIEDAENICQKRNITSPSKATQVKRINSKVALICYLNACKEFSRCYFDEFSNNIELNDKEIRKAKKNKV